MANKPQIRVFVNNDQAIIAWMYNASIKNCIGFAIFKKVNNESDVLAEPLKNKVGFEGQPHQNGEQRPSTEWPIQRFTWADFSVKTGDIVRYKVVPILISGDQLIKGGEEISTDWSDSKNITSGDDYQAYFNRGIISSQFFNYMKTEFANELDGTSVKAIIGGGDNRVRKFLGGNLSQKLFDILDGIRNNPSLTVYGALYELQQNDLIDKLKSIGKRANIVLANGSFKTKNEDKNHDSRQELKDAGVNVYDRIVDPGHFGHNKFLVICENGIKKHIWTGSTNWTPGGLFSQVNNGLLIKNNQELATSYFEEWEALRNAGNSSTDPDLFNKNTTSLPDNNFPHTWFSPKAATGDIDEVSTLMNNAQKSILFLMFNPGPKGTLFNSILDIQNQKPDFFIRGVINQDPRGKDNLIFFKDGQQNSSNWDEILPDKISHDLGYFTTEESAGLVTIHSKVIVIDPFTENGYVITGSNNMGPKASLKNDDNLIIIKDKKLVEEYAVNILAVYDHYRWRYSLSKADPNFNGLTKNSNWMDEYLKNNRASEIKKFWFNN